MRRQLWLLFLISLFFAVSLHAQQVLPAIKTATAPRMDGLLIEEIWSTITPLTHFVVNAPNPGDTPSVKTEVRIFYSDDAVYIGAKIFDKPSDIRRQLTARDGFELQDCDYFAVNFDTYLDSQNAFYFLVSPANVQSDARISPQGSGSNFDYAWDAVWDSRITIQPDGWYLEMKIPYLSLRFARTDLQNWGINFTRYVRRSNELSHWNFVNPKQAGIINQNGVWTGLSNIVPPLRLSILPYISAGYQSVPVSSGRTNNVLRNGGMDVKWGVNESFTLDMTLIPDFGQVVSDNVVLNLSPFEQQFDENRPFFTEGTELFSKSALFYSRRVGQRPVGYNSARRLAADSGYTLLRNPGITQLYNASKFSGRNRNNLGIGVFNAVAAPMYATYRDKSGNEHRLQTSPLTNYNIVVLDQALKNRSSITFTNTHTWRAGSNSRKANVSALDLNLFNKKNSHRLTFSGRFSQISGPSRYNGFRTFTEWNKVSGKWQGGFFNVIESDKYDINDLGLLQAPNEVTSGAFIRYTQFDPNKTFNFRRYQFRIRQENLYKPFRFGFVSYSANFFHLFKNFWDVNLELEGQPFRGYNHFELRIPGRRMQRVRWAYAGVYGSTDSRKKLFVRYGGGYGLSEFKKEPYINYSGGIRYRFNPKFSLEINGDKSLDKSDAGFRYFDATGEPVIGRRHVREVTTGLNGIYNFKARMNLTMRLRHYWSDVHYLSFFRVDAAGKWLPAPFSPNRDQSFNAFNIDMFYTWDFMLGSRLIVAWKNALGPEVNLDRQQFPIYTRNVRGVISSPHSNEVSVRLVYFLDYNTLRRKKDPGNQVSGEIHTEATSWFSTSGQRQQQRS